LAAPCGHASSARPLCSTLCGSASTARRHGQSVPEMEKKRFYNMLIFFNIFKNGTTFFKMLTKGKMS
jgi:hypothetical protein